MIIADTQMLAPAEATTNPDARRREARTLIKSRTAQTGEETTSVELVVRHDRDAKAYITELRHHIELRKPNGRTSVVYKLAGGVRTARFTHIPAARYSEAKLEGLYEDAFEMLNHLIAAREENVIALLS